MTPFASKGEEEMNPMILVCLAVLAAIVVSVAMVRRNRRARTGQQ